MKERLIKVLTYLKNHKEEVKTTIITIGMIIGLIFGITGCIKRIQYENKEGVLYCEFDLNGNIKNCISKIL